MPEKPCDTCGVVITCDIQDCDRKHFCSIHIDQAVMEEYNIA